MKRLLSSRSKGSARWGCHTRTLGRDTTASWRWKSGSDWDLPANSQREPPDTKKKVSMSVSGPSPGRTASQARNPAAPQPQSHRRCRRRRVFLAPASPRRCGDPAGGGGRSARSSRNPTPSPAARPGLLGTETAASELPSPTGGGAGRPPRNVLGETGWRKGLTGAQPLLPHPSTYERPLPPHDRPPGFYG